MSYPTVQISPTGTIQSFVVPLTGHYVIEAAGAQGGAGGGPGGRGARVKGTFFLTRGESLKIVVGEQGTAGTTQHQTAGGGGGGTFVWRSAVTWPLPARPLLVAGGGGGGNGGGGLVSLDGGAGAAPGGRGGRGGESDRVNFHYSGGGGTGWISGGDMGSTPTLCGGGTQWRGGAGANYCCNQGGWGGYGGGGGGSFIGHGSGGGGGYSGGGGGTQNGPHAGGGGSFNTGTHQANTADTHVGDGQVTLTLIATEATGLHRYVLPAYSEAQVELPSVDDPAHDGRRPRTLSAVL